MQPETLKTLGPKIFDFPDLAVLLQQKEADKYSSPKALIHHLPADFIQHKFKHFLFSSLVTLRRD